MKVTSIIENTSKTGLPVEHGLSLYIEKADGQKVLFDMGQSSLFAENAKRLALNIADIDMAIISHGHYDHGGGFETFLSLNSKAKVWIHKDAFLPHYSLKETGLRYIGLNTELEGNDRLVKCENAMVISPDMTLFANVCGDCCRPRGNRLLFGPSKAENDAFGHEQNLIIKEGSKTILFAGCAHNGIVNILRKAEEVMGEKPTHVLAGMHLVKSGLNEEEENTFIATLAKELMSYKGCQFYTMHCTGTEQYEKLKAIMGDQIEYLSCGDTITI